MTHTPIPDQLGYRFRSQQELPRDPWHPWHPLPPDLDKLFRASPKLAEALRAVDAAFAFNVLNSTTLCDREAALIKVSDALALLED